MYFKHIPVRYGHMCLFIFFSVIKPTVICENVNIIENESNSMDFENTSTIFMHKTDKSTPQKTYNYKHRWKSVLNVIDTCNKDVIFPEIQSNHDTNKRLLAEIEENISSTNLNSSTEFIAKDNLSEEYITISTTGTDENELKENKGQSIDVTSTVRNVTMNEDMPSFREWTKKQLEEAEKQPAINETKYKHDKKVLKKNYASPECGAKVVSTNPEAKYPHLLLTKPTDEYLLNLCKSTTWFVVELCEAIQIKKIELGNFELFSSTPKEFSVYVASRLNARVWMPIADLVAEDVRVLQGFVLNTTDENEFNKYIKVEIHSHYGKEHYCPISVFNAYGLSEIEVLERADENGLETNNSENEDENEDAYEFDVLDENIQNNQSKSTDSTNTLLDSARVAVMSIVKIAADVLDMRQKNTNNYSSYTVDSADNNTLKILLSKCITPGYIMVCHGCDDIFYKKMFDTISCEADQLTEMYQSRFIHNTIINSDACAEYGLDFLSLKKNSRRKILISDRRKKFILSIFPRVKIAALCNTLAIVHKKIVLNKAKRVYISDDLIINLQTAVPDVNGEITNNNSTNLQESNDTLNSAMSVDNKSPLNISSYIEPIISQILPTKTFLSTEEETDSSKKNIVKESSTELNENITQPSSLFIEPNSTNEIPVPSSTQFVASTIVEKPTDSGVQNTFETDVTNDEKIVEQATDSFDSFFKDFEVEENESDKCHSTTTETVQHTVQPLVQSPNTKQSLFIRLANRIKDLERNMSLSGEYLQELSTRYKKQVDDMQRTILELAEENRLKREQDLKILGEMKILSEQVASLQNSLHCLKTETENLNLFSVIIPESNPIKFGILCLIIVAYIILKITGIIGKKNQEHEWKNSKTGSSGRRQSTNDILSNLKEKHRRPSEEALFSSGTTHQDLLIRNGNGENVKNERKRRKKRKELILKSKSNAINLEAGGNIVSNIKLQSTSSLTQSNRRASSSDLTACNGTTHDFMKTALSVRNKRMSGPLQDNVSFLQSNKNKNVTESKSRTIKTFLKKIF